MFKLSSRTNYGISALIELARHHDTGIMQIRDISRRKGIPKQYLEQIFNRLNRREIIRSIRGKMGGYMLARDPEDISLFEIIEVLEGETDISSQSDITAVRELFGKVNMCARDILDVSLARLVEMQEKHEKQIMYHI